MSDENAFLFFWGGGKGEMKFLNFFFEFFGLDCAVAVSVCMYEYPPWCVIVKSACIWDVQTADPDPASTFNVIE